MSFRECDASRGPQAESSGETLVEQGEQEKPRGNCGGEQAVRSELGEPWRGKQRPYMERSSGVVVQA